MSENQILYDSSEPTSSDFSHEKREDIVNSVNSKLTAEMMRLHPEEAFHNEIHIDNVARDSVEILELFLRYNMVKKEDVLATESAVKGHDLIINFTTITDPSAKNYGQIVRHCGFEDTIPENVEKLGIEKGNEELSWLKTLQIISESDPEGFIYTPQVLEKIRTGISGTYPEISFAQIPETATIIKDPENGEEIDLTPYLATDAEGRPSALKFDQPYLRSESADITTLAVAFGDLMYAGKCDAEDFIHQGNNEYKEVNAFTVTEVTKNFASLSHKRKATIAGGMISWIESQVGFLLWQKVRFEETLQTFKPILKSPHKKEIREDFSALYNKFDINLIRAKQRIEMSRRFDTLKNIETYTENPEESFALFTELLKEFDMNTNQ